MPFNEDNYYKAFEDTEKFLKESITKNKSDIMKQAIEVYLENGGSIEFLKHFEQ